MSEDTKDGYGRCVPPCKCSDCGRPRSLAQTLVAEIGSVGPENAEDIVARVVAALQARPAIIDTAVQAERERANRAEKALARLQDCIRGRAIADECEVCAFWLLDAPSAPVMPLTPESQIQFSPTPHTGPTTKPGR